MADHLGERTFIISLTIIIYNAGTRECLESIIIKNPALIQLLTSITSAELFTLIAFTQLFAFVGEHFRFSQINWLRLNL
jgi:hypothetical protein